MLDMQHETFLRFPNGLEKAFTLSYDDGVVADKRFLKVIDSYGVKCTFNINSGVFPDKGSHNRMDEKETFATFSNCRHELALHGHRHLFLTKVSAVQCAQEIVANREYMEEKYNRVVCGMAYAYGATDERICDMLRSLGVHYSRTTDSTGTFDIPKDFLRWNPTCHHTDKKLSELAEKFVKTAPSDERKAREPYLFYVWGHSYEFDEQNNWHVLDDLLKVVAKRKDVWYATNGEIYDYVTAFNRLVWGISDQLVYNPSALDIWVERDKKLYRIPSGQTVKFHI